MARKTKTPVRPSPDRARRNDEDLKFTHRFGKALLAWRDAKGLSIAKAAEELKVPERSFQNWLQGATEPKVARCPRAATLIRIVERLIEDGFWKTSMKL